MAAKSLSVSAMSAPAARSFRCWIDRVPGLVKICSLWFSSQAMANDDVRCPISAANAREDAVALMLRAWLGGRNLGSTSMKFKV